jgi:hypothetical protein
MSTLAKQTLIVSCFTLIALGTYILGSKHNLGSVTIQANVSNFSYEVAGQTKTCQLAPCYLELKPKTYNLVVRKPGFYEQELSVRAKQGQSNSVTVNLQKQPQLAAISQSETLDFYKTQSNFLSYFDSNQKQFVDILSLSPGQTLAKLSLSGSGETVLLNYQSGDSYIYDLLNSQSRQLEFPANISVIDTKLYSDSQIIVETSEKQVLFGPVGSLKASEFTMLPVSSPSHYLEVSQGDYLIITPLNLATSSAKASSSLTAFTSILSSNSSTQDSAAEDSQIDLFKGSNLYFYSSLTKKHYFLQAIESTQSDQVALDLKLVNQNLTPILKDGKSFYKLSL